MLGKLLKYDFMAIGRLLLPLYGALMVLALLIGISAHGRSDLSMSLWVLLYIGVIMAGMFLTAYLLIERFYHNLLGNEGYLMFALPVTTADHVIEKMLSALIWVFIGVAAVLLSGILMAVFAVPWADLSAGFREFFLAISRGEISGDTFSQFVQILLALAVSMLMFIAKVYCSIAVGHLWSGHRILGGFLAFILISIIEVSVGVNAGQGLVRADNIWMYLVMGLAWSAVLSAGTWYILDRRLNLE